MLQSVFADAKEGSGRRLWLSISGVSRRPETEPR